MIHRAEEGGYWAEVPALPGCYSQGEIIEAALSNIREAIAAHLIALRKEQDVIPIDEELVIGRVKLEVAGVDSAT